MTHSIDASFRLRKQALAAKRRRERWRKILVGVGAFTLLSLGVAAYFTADYWSFSDYDEELEITEGADQVPEDAPVYVPAIVDLAGDPMWINLSGDSGAAARGRSIARPAELAEAGVSPQIEILSDTMLSSSERFMTTIPSTQEDFAFFQAQRTIAANPAANLQTDFLPTPPSDSDSDPQSETIADPGAGWGETINAGEAELPDFQRTEIENNTSVATVAPEPERFEATQDIFVKILNTRSLDSVVLEGHFSADQAKLAGEALKTLFNRDNLEAGYVVAMRGYRPRRAATKLSLMQVSVYTKDTFIGTLARNSVGMFVSGVDPWVRDDLFNYSGTSDEGAHKRQYRLLDAIYSTAARNNVPTGVIGEAIMYLSRGQDLNAFATYSERLVLVYSQTARGKDGVAGRVLYAGVHGPEKKLECFVFQQSDGEFACVAGDDLVHSLTVTNGMVNPVNGVMTSTFGPRKHPILGTVRIHKGVDWAAPVGTPIVAAFDGEVVFQGDGGGYGNLVRISHGNGRETRYAHMQRFALTDGVGKSVKAGDVVGYVGTTGLSTGPHLHFELYQNSEAIDPLGTVTVVASDGSAVEMLTDRIIHVESGGSARAKNPLSSATGLGQFISSTWIRMMNTYRPDLARTLSRDELLALRFDPTISREMVRNLAREGEAYLRARGHQITAGRLYLCHFLGMEGAHLVLSTSGRTMLVDVLGSSVISANPFLTGKNVDYVMNWAERKMRGRSWTAPQPSVSSREIRQTSPEFEAYKNAIAAIVNSTETAL
jgi:murein DD-endopeptidase MepM/ murein hydrolase activator NlpD